MSRDENETLEHLLLECYRTVEMRNKMESIHFKTEINTRSVFMDYLKKTYRFKDIYSS